MATRSIHITTFGCQMNKADSELSLGVLAEKGYRIAPDEASADVILFNTCSVRQHAEDKVYSRLAQLKRRKDNNPKLLIGVLGCMAQKEAQQFFKRFPHVDMVCGTRMFDKLPDLLERLNDNGKHLLAVGEKDNVTYYPKHRTPGQHPYQAFVTVIRGCNNICSYCIVPSVRGHEISRPVEEIVKEITALARNGVKEVTLLGQNINTYGSDLAGGINLGTLFRAVHDVEGIKRIRFVTSHPKDMTLETLDAMAALPKVCRHLHMPAQSGSDRILRQMQRGHTAEYYIKLTEEARRLMPDITIASDSIVGFPGETAEDFEDTIKLMRVVRFQNSFIFKYSPRPGTPAASLPDDVPMEVKKERNQILLSLQSEISLEENHKMLGKVVEVLAEGPSKNDKQKLVGRTTQNHIVVFEGPLDLRGEIARVEVCGATALTLFGRLCNASPTEN
ncbi:MAG TPA: tRNA (N6-isopentenyl adenosine(37)-C2)-methylthiotransferase MiaB [Candidatus Avalokitesvara rifleensis]|uniref:tRNA (N6-isopentenyl adenosine(37)-C2)-methylthiotransferase MiaB n=1 Tax=Candidatus Avalokitesvara rifleensis TaxID=3367620 RepID=UPI00402A53E8